MKILEKKDLERKYHIFHILNPNSELGFDDSVEAPNERLERKIIHNFNTEYEAVPNEVVQLFGHKKN